MPGMSAPPARYGTLAVVEAGAAFARTRLSLRKSRRAAQACERRRLRHRRVCNADVLTVEWQGLSDVRQWRLRAISLAYLGAVPRPADNHAPLSVARLQGVRDRGPASGDRHPRRQTDRRGMTAVDRVFLAAASRPCPAIEQILISHQDGGDGGGRRG